MTDSKENEASYSFVKTSLINKHKKKIINFTMGYVSKYIKLIRIDNKKPLTIDAHSKDQLMYILVTLVGIAEKMNDNVPDDIQGWIESSLDVKSINYKMYKFLTGTVNNMKYTMLGMQIEEDVLGMIAPVIEDEELMQHVVEVFLLFVRKFARKLAGFSWKSTKNVSSISTNGILRNMDDSNVNPDLFDNIYGYGNYVKGLNKKNTT